MTVFDVPCRIGERGDVTVLGVPSRIGELGNEYSDGCCMGTISSSCSSNVTLLGDVGDLRIGWSSAVFFVSTKTPPFAMLDAFGCSSFVASKLSIEPTLAIAASFSSIVEAIKDPMFL